MAKIVALVDGSVYSQSVCDHAAWIATRIGASIEALHVLGKAEGAKSDLSGNIGLGARSRLMEELAELDAAQAKLGMKRGRAILEDAEARLSAAGVGAVTSRLRHGDLVEELHDAEADADLVVIGKRGEAADFATLRLGSNLERVVRASEKPVLVTSREFQPIKRFLIAFDGGKSALKAINHVATSKVFAGLDCVLLGAGAETTDSRRAIEGAAAGLRDAGYNVEIRMVEGRADTAMTDAVAQCDIDMVLMGAYKHSRIRNLFIGSITTEMVRSCQVPLILFR